MTMGHSARTMRYSPWATAAVAVGLALSALAALSAHLGRSAIASHIRAGYPSYGDGEISSAASVYVTCLSVLGALAVLGWSVTWWAMRRGHPGARWIGSVLFLVGTALSTFSLLVRDTSGDTGLSPLIGGAGMLPCVVGLLAVALMWTRSTRTHRSGSEHRLTDAR